MNRIEIMIMTMIIAMVVFLGGCKNQNMGPDQTMRQKLFLQCLQNVPNGPQSTRYNDWDEVITACDDVAYYQSIRVEQ